MALDSYYRKTLTTIFRKEEHQGKTRSTKDAAKLAAIQETLQYITLTTNIRTNKLNEDLATSANITPERMGGEDATPGSSRREGEAITIPDESTNNPEG